MKIYTKKGDQGKTSLFGGQILSKDHERIEAYGCVDELNSVLGCVVSVLKTSNLQKEILEIQKQLFVLGSELAYPSADERLRSGFLKTTHIEQLEKQIDSMETTLNPLKQFILPGGSQTASFLHLARTVCRRAEREAVHLSHTENLRSELLIYLNRLSDYLFVAARFANHLENRPDLLWEGLSE
ncbi:MAG: cob(I)yrinic acid a,c-diamide adenosyltransferase [Deltaproteobacteria bacterium]|nr:cob(I)yrinic acid a,c-diamide adenosyltransferase [Deltaproteobacteria bacterium]